MEARIILFFVCVYFRVERGEKGKFSTRCVPVDAMRGDRKRREMERAYIICIKMLHTQKS